MGAVASLPNYIYNRESEERIKRNQLLQLLKEDLQQKIPTAAQVMPSRECSRDYEELERQAQAVSKEMLRWEDKEDIP
jgi:tRNA(Glu) U13 pseudouridine synthase TruD